MDNVQKHNTCSNVPSSQTFRSYKQQQTCRIFYGGGQSAVSQEMSEYGGKAGFVPVFESTKQNHNLRELHQGQVTSIKNSKAIPVTGRGGPYVCEKSRLTLFYRESAHRSRWGCQPYAPAAFYPQEDSWYSFLSSWVSIARGRSCAANSFVRLPCSCPGSKRGSRVPPLIDAVPQFSRDHVNTARAGASFMLMLKIIEGKNKPKRKVRRWMKECNKEIDLCEIWHLN
jgi:hypothetical protein